MLNLHRDSQYFIMMNNDTIKIERVTTGYRNSHGCIAVTKDLEADLLCGELTCLLGPNGAGKTTLLKTLSGFLPPLEGNIYLNGVNIYDYKESERARLIGVVLTDRLSLTNMTVEQLVELGRSPYTGFFGRPSSSDRSIVDEAIELVGIADLRQRSVVTLSDGERQKALIAKALAQETPVIFLDEPTAFLDYPSKAEIMLLLRGLASDKGKTVFISTHYLELALQIADKIWLLDKNKGLSIGSPSFLAKEGEIGRYFDRDGLKFDKEAGVFRIIV